MSRPRSGSPRYRRFPWDERDFDPYKVLAELDESPSDVSHHSREDVREHRDYFREDVFPEGQRRSSPFPDDQFGHKHLDQEEFYRRRPSPRHDAMDRLFSPLRDGGSDGERRRGGFKEDLQSFQNRGRSPFSPVRLPREKLPLTPKTHSDHSQRVPGIGWRREEQGRDRGRFRDLDPSVRSDDQRGSGSERGGRNAQSANRGRRREDLRQERSPSLKRQRREMDDSDHLRYRNEESFGEPRYSVGTSRDGLGGDTHGSLSRGDSQHLGPLVVEHDHGIADSREQRRWERLDDRGNRNSDLNRQRSPRPMSSSQQHFRKSSSRSDVREDIRGRPLQDNWRDSKYHEPRRNPLPQDKPNPNRYGNRDGPTHQRGKSGSRPARGKFERHPGGRTGLPQNQPHSERPSQGYQDLPHEQHRHGYRAQREDSYEDAVKEEPNWAEEDRLQQWESDRPGSLDRLPPRDLDPKMPRQREQGWTDQKPDNTNVVTEETLTIKVDMSRPANQKSPLCYSTDRQLSLDLVNVGRQRLDFLPMLEHSGTFRETATHTGTFAQEIITLVHHVKELYFRGDGVTLSERFSAPQKGSYAEEETEELTLDERFTSNRGFSPNLNSVLDDEQPLFSRLGTLQGFGQQPMRGPGDLRHDLERRRQERLEGVKVTIPGNSLSQRPLGPAGEQSLEYSDMDEKPPMEDEGFCSWPMEQNRRWEGIDRAKRGDSYRSNTGPQRRNNRNRLGPMRRQNNRSNHEGPNW